MTPTLPGLGFSLKSVLLVLVIPEGAWSNLLTFFLPSRQSFLSAEAKEYLEVSLGSIDCFCNRSQALQYHQEVVERLAFT